MCVGMEAVIGLMHTEHGMNLDFDKVNDVLSQGDRMWVGIGESYAENAAEEAMRAAVSMLFDEAGTSVQGLLGSLSGPLQDGYCTTLQSREHSVQHLERRTVCLGNEDG